MKYIYYPIDIDERKGTNDTSATPKHSISNRDSEDHPLAKLKKMLKPKSKTSVPDF